VPAVPEYRAHFDARIEFANGGGLTAEAFRLDVPGPDVDEATVARLLVQHLGLALVGSVRLTDLRIVEEQHRGSRGIEAAPAASGRRIVDLSHVIRAGLVTYPEESRARYAPGTEFALDLITMIGNTGTYLDSPFHRYADGADLAGLDLATLVDLPAEVLHLQDVAPGGAGRREIPAEVFFDRELRGAAVLLHTGWDAHFGAPAYATGSPYLSRDGVAHLVEQGVALVGIDALNIDDTESGGERPAHSGLLAAGIHVVEHLTGLGELPAARGARFTAVPPAVEGFGTFPVRAVATVD